MNLLANAEVTQAVVESTNLFPANFWAGLLGTVIYALVAAVLFPIFWKLLDWVTPGDLNKQLLGHTISREGVVTHHTANGQPNLALAIVVGFLGLGFCHILAAAIH